MYCSMELNILFESDSNQQEEWEKIEKLSEMEKLVSEVAGINIVDNRKYIHNLEELISKERLKRFFIFSSFFFKYT